MGEIDGYPENIEASQEFHRLSFRWST